MPDGLDAAFWTRFRSIAIRIEENTAALRERTSKSEEVSRIRRAIEIAGGFAGVAGLVLALIGLHQNAVALDGLSDSLQRSNVQAAFELSTGPCGNAETGEITSMVAGTYLTNTGRMPITVVHVGDGSNWVNDFAYVRIDENPPVARRGPFYLEVGQAVAVRYGSTSLELGRNITLRLSDGTTVTATLAGGDSRWLVFTDIGETLHNAQVECPSGTPLEIPWTAFLDQE